MALVQRAKINFFEAQRITFFNALPVFRCKSSPLNADAGFPLQPGLFFQLLNFFRRLFNWLHKASDVEVIAPGEVDSPEGRIRNRNRYRDKCPRGLGTEHGKSVEEGDADALQKSSQCL